MFELEDCIQEPSIDKYIFCTTGKIVAIDKNILLFSNVPYRVTEEMLYHDWKYGGTDVKLAFFSYCFSMMVKFFFFLLIFMEQIKPITFFSYLVINLINESIKQK